MRVGNLDGRAVLISTAGRALDVAEHSGGAFGPDPQRVFEDWARFCGWADGVDVEALATAECPPERLAAPVPRPRQVLAVGLNYREHATETRLAAPETPLVFTKFASCLTGPVGQVALPPGGATDWEVEIVVVIGAVTRRVPVERAWEHVAGITVGQDLSERRGQFAGAPPQFSLAKSHPGFGPTGPWVVTPDELADRDDVPLRCTLNGEQVQKASTRDMIFPIPALLAALSRTVTLLPGDLLFTGTPSGVGMGRDPQRSLAPGDELVSAVDGVGTMRQVFVAGDPE